MRFFIVLLYLYFFSTPLMAISYVGGVAVDKNETNVELRFSQEYDGEADDRFRMRQHIDYGFNDMLAFRIVTVQAQSEDQGLSHNNITLESRIQVIEMRDYGFNSGFRIAYRKVDFQDNADLLQGRFLNEFFLGGHWRLRQNFIAQREVGAYSQDGIEFSMRHQIFKRLDHLVNISSLGIGIEIWNNFDRVNQSTSFEQEVHQIGGTVEFEPFYGILIRPHYLGGISKASPDHVLGISFGKKL